MADSPPRERLKVRVGGFLIPVRVSHRHPDGRRAGTEARIPEVELAGIIGEQVPRLTIYPPRFCTTTGTLPQAPGLAGRVAVIRVADSTDTPMAATPSRRMYRHSAS